MATGTSSRVTTPAFHAGDPDDTTEYRTLSVLAIVSLIFGLASPLCFGATLLMVIPLFGILISILALQRIAASDGALAGGWAAATGLVLCVVFATAPITRTLVLRMMRTHQAEAFGRSWIELLLAGETERAFRLTIESTRPASRPEPGRPAPKESPFDMFKDQPEVKALAAAGPDATVRFEGNLAYESPSFARVLVRQKYSVIPQPTRSGASAIDLLLTLERMKLAAEGRSRWLVYSLADSNKVAPAVPQ
jgi:hypothetical protein